MSRTTAEIRKTELEANPIAFPLEAHYSDGSWTTNYGLTKREYYACAAMHGLLASGASYDMDRIEIAAESVKYAEALQAALAAQPPVNDNESGGKG